MNCPDAVGRWEAAFETGDPPPAAVAEHLGVCPDCAGRAAAAVAARRAVRALPVPPPDPAADAALLAALRAAPTARGALWGWLFGAPDWPRAWRAPAAGGLSFLVTLGLAVALTRPPAEAASVAEVTRAPVAQAAMTDANAQVEAWLAMPIPTLLPPAALPLRGPGAPPPARRGDRERRLPSRTTC